MKVITSEELKQAVLDYGELATRSKSFGGANSGSYKAICHVIDALYARPDAIELEARLAVAQEGLTAAREACDPHPTADVGKPIAEIVAQRLRIARGKIAEAEDLAEDRFAAWGHVGALYEVADKMRCLLVSEDRESVDACNEYDALKNLNDGDACLRLGIDVPSWAAEVRARIALSTLRAQVIETLDALDRVYCEFCDRSADDLPDEDKRAHDSACPLGKLRAAVTAETP